MGVDDADAAVLVDVVAAEEQIAQLEAELAGGVARRVPDFELQIADLDHVAFVEQHVDLARRHRDLDVLRLDGGKGHDLVAGLERLDAQRMGGDLGLEQFPGPGQALDVVGVGMRGDHHLAGGQVEVHLADQLDDFVDGFEIADVDQDELAAAVDEIDVDAQPPAGLVVHLDDVREEIFPSAACR